VIYRLHREGQNLGAFPLDELQRRRATGELGGNEFVWCEGMPDWEPLDSMLERSALAGSQPRPPPVPTSARKRTMRPAVKVLIGVSIAVACGLFLFGVRSAYRAVRLVRNAGLSSPGGPARATRSDAYAAASKPVVWTSNTWTAAVVNDRSWQFRKRQWVEGYELRGDRTEACDADALRFVQAWISSEYGGDVGANPPNIPQLARKLADDPTCTDPLVLTVAGLKAPDSASQINRLERALKAYPASKHLAYPQLDATVTLAKDLGGASPRVQALDLAALDLLKRGFIDGSFQPDDQPEILETLLHGWGQGFYSRNQAAVTRMTGTVGAPFQWLALVLEGDHHISAAWKARGGGYADSVTPAGWQTFASELAAARRCLTRAWELHPEYPYAPARMIYVSLGDSDITEMRRWFDRAVTAQIDLPEAWSDLAWGLRPRWYGDPESKIAFGITAAKTGRFDTSVPEQLFSALNDLKQENQELTEAELYGRPDVWPWVSKVYESYITAGPASQRDGRRNTYFMLCCLVGKYDSAQKQIEALNWKPDDGKIVSMGLDPTLLPLEVAARTGSSGAQVNRAESARDHGDPAGAARIYAGLLAAPGMDERTRKFTSSRVATLALEQGLAEGGWADFLPQSHDDPNWYFSWGDRQVTDGALNAGLNGWKNFFFFSRARIGRDFEVRGEFDVVQAPKQAFQAGLIMGVPDYSEMPSGGFALLPGGGLTPAATSTNITRLVPGIGGSTTNAVAMIPGQGVNPATRLVVSPNGTIGFAAPPWYALVMQRAANGRELASFSTGLGTPGVSSPASLNETNNTFDITMHGDVCTATVNGRLVFSDVRPLQALDKPAADFFLGVTGSTQNKDGLIRYRKLQVRKLPPDPGH
jgi:hypothetical protein